MSNRRFGLVALLMVALVGLIAGMVFTAKLDIFNQVNGESPAAPAAQAQPASHTLTPSPDISDQPLTFDAFRKIAKRLNPAVVNIYTTQIIRGRDPFQDFFGGDDFFRRFFGDQNPNQQRESRQNALGSGVIIDATGYILTNNHVVENADEIRVSSEDTGGPNNGIVAKVIGRDPKTDLALIKITPKTQLVAAPLGDSSLLQVGDWVIAIGNPFGLGHTVTVGVVSAKGRALGGNYDDYIQTDASINPGNSGGPLLNIRGEVIGVNAAIASQTGQSAGIGFAIPINLAKDILPQLKTTGRVIRGQLGVTIQTQWNDAMAREFGVDHGAVVSDVTKGSSADKAGIQRGDVIVQFNGKEIENGSDLPRLVAATKPGTEATLKLIRDKKEKTVNITIGTMKDTEVAENENQGEGEEATTGLGLTVTDLDPQAVRQLDLDSDEGVLITRVKVNSPADEAGLQHGDVILEMNRQPVKDLATYRELAAKVKAGDTVLFLIFRRGGSFFVPVEIPKR
ncbi:MAG TPA: DegQ family serine endoprotease [Acidobacteriota bacterium]|nr:DegQ family serine endoprotease [Acidobacteriota bacterium]